MDLIILVLVCCFIGFVIYLLTEKIPMPEGWKVTIQLFALLIIVLYLLSHFVTIPNVLSK